MSTSKLGIDILHVHNYKVSKVILIYQIKTASGHFTGVKAGMVCTCVEALKH